MVFFQQPQKDEMLLLCPVFYLLGYGFLRNYGGYLLIELLKALFLLLRYLLEYIMGKLILCVVITKI